MRVNTAGDGIHRAIHRHLFRNWSRRSVGERSDRSHCTKLLLWPLSFFDHRQRPSSLPKQPHLRYRPSRRRDVVAPGDASALPPSFVLNPSFHPAASVAAARLDPYLLLSTRSIARTKGTRLSGEYLCCLRLAPIAELRSFVVQRRCLVESG